MSSLRDRILAIEDIPTETITVPQWGNISLQIRGMSGKDRSGLMKSALDSNNELDFSKLYPLLIIATAHDPETGERVFSDSDLNAINEKSGAALELVGKVAARLSGMDKESSDDMGKPSSLGTSGSTESADSLSS